MRSKRGVGLLFALLYFSIFAGGLRAGDASDVGSDPKAHAMRIFSAAVENIRRVESIQFAVAIDGNTSGNYELYYATGEKFRVDSVRDWGDDKDPMSVREPIQTQCYNGELYQGFDGMTKNLAFSKFKGDGDFDRKHFSTPLERACSFLFNGAESRGLPKLKDLELWERRLPKVVHVRSDNYRGIPCDVVGFRHHENGYNWEVFFAESLGMLPVKTVSRDGEDKVFATTEVDSWKEFPEFNLVLPLEVVRTSDHGVTASSIVEGSLKVNELIDDDLFTISPTLAEELIDYDNGKLRIVGSNRVIDIDEHGVPVNKTPKALFGEPLPKNRRHWQIFAAVNVAFIACFFLFWGLRRQSS